MGKTIIMEVTIDTENDDLDYDDLIFEIEGTRTLGSEPKVSVSDVTVDSD